MMNVREIELEVMRFDPEKDEAPWFKKYIVPCQEDWAILDALNYVKDNLDTTLAYRWSCHMMVCGSCGMMVNGEPALTCKTFIRELPDKVKIEPGKLSLCGHINCSRRPYSSGYKGVASQ